MAAEAPSDRRVQLSVPDAYKKVDEGVWEELESYLFTGFLTSTAVVAGQSFVFKTLNHHEVRNIGYMRPSKATMVEAKASFTAGFIAHSVFMFNGNNVLHDRARSISRLIKAVSKLPAKVQDKVLENLSFLNARVSILFPLVEVYAYENRSRFRWYQLGSMSVHDSRATGLPGTDALGMTLCQQTWTSINALIDRRELAEREWANAKFVGSCFAGKGIRSLEERDRSRLENERVEREEKKLQVLHAYLNRTTAGAPAAQALVLPDGRRADVQRKFQSESVEELLDELSASLSGEKDHHDLVIERKQAQLRERAKSIESERLKIMHMTSSIPVGSQIGSGGARVLGGKEEVDAYLRRMEEVRDRQMMALRKNQFSEGREPSDEGSKEGGP